MKRAAVDFPWVMALAVRFTVGVSAVGAISAVGIGCSRGRSAELADAQVLQEVLGADQALEAALREADALSRTDAAKAAEVLETRATKEADQVIARANAAQVTSAWGNDRKMELKTLAEQRRASLATYAKALREGDPKTKLSAIEGQLDLQRRALEVAAKVSIPPPP